MVRSPRSSMGPCFASARRGSMSRAALANSSSGSGSTSIFSGRAIDQTSFLNIDAYKASLKQEVADVRVADVDRGAALGEEPCPEGEIALDIGVAVELDPARRLAGAHVAWQRRHAVTLGEHIERLDPDSPYIRLADDFV